MVGKTKKIYDLKFSKKKDLYDASQMRDNIFHNENFFIRTSKRNLQKMNKFEKYRNNNNYKGYEPNKNFYEKPRPRKKTYSYEGEFTVGYKKKNFVNDKKNIQPKQKIELVRNKKFEDETIKNVKKEKNVKKKKSSVYFSKNPFEVFQTNDNDDSDF